MQPPDSPRRHETHFWRRVLIGFFTLAPLWVTWLVVDFVYRLLARTGMPFLRAAARAVRPFSEIVADWLLNSAVHLALAALITVLMLYVAGVLASLVVGRRLIARLDDMVQRVPLIQTVYGATKRFLHTLKKPPVTGQRVVLISFPTPEMKAVGFVTKIMRDVDTGEELAAVYVPTSPNPTSGYIEIVPLRDVVFTGWSVEEAMSFVMTGGTNAPDTIRFAEPAKPAPPRT